MLYRVDPFVDSNGILRVGGRLRRATLEYTEKYPVLLPKKYHVTDLVILSLSQTVRSRTTRGGAANSKCYGLIFTCLSSRAIPIEVLESMDMSSFICALRRFFALRGPVSNLRCDRWTSFIGGKSELEVALREIDQCKVEGYVNNQGCKWIFNPPHASHFGGASECQIGTIRREWLWNVVDWSVQWTKLSSKIIYRIIYQIKIKKFIKSSLVTWLCFQVPFNVF